MTSSTALNKLTLLKIDTSYKDKRFSSMCPKDAFIPSSLINISSGRQNVLNGLMNLAGNDKIYNRFLF